MKKAKPITARLDSRGGTHPVPLQVSGSWASADVLRQTLLEVERDEAEAISTLCALLERIETSSNFNGLAQIREVLKEWQNQPPRGIVTHLIRIGETLKCPDRDNT